MNYIMLFIILFITHNALLSSELYTLSNLQKEELETRLKALPTDIKKHIYYMVLNDYINNNKNSIKNYVQETLTVPDYRQQWWVTESYFSFKNCGSQCTHIIAFYPVQGTPQYKGRISTSHGDQILGAHAIVFIHTLKDKNIHTIDCMTQETQMQAPSCYNSIKLSDKKKGWVHMLYKNTNELDVSLLNKTT